MFIHLVPIWWILSRLDSGEEDKVPHAGLPPSQQLTSHKAFDKTSEQNVVRYSLDLCLTWHAALDSLIIMFMFAWHHHYKILSLSGSKFWVIICKHSGIGTQQLIRINQYLVEKQDFWISRNPVPILLLFPRPCLHLPVTLRGHEM